MIKQRSGALTLVAVFLIGAVALIILMADNIRAVGLHTRVHAQTISEQAFYSAQSCLEEGFYQLKKDEKFTGLTNLPVGDSTCSAAPTVLNSPNGALSSQGTSGHSIRTIVSNYHDAGPTTTRLHTQIFHLIDRSGSMQEDSCSKPSYHSQSDCVNHHFMWGPILQPITDTKQAAIQFNDDFMDSAFDQVGLVSFSGTATLNQALTSDRTAVNAAIASLTANGSTDIGAAIDLATSKFPAPSGMSQVEILLTDGVPNSSCGVDCTIARAEAAKSKGITIFTIGLGTATNPALLQSIASPDPLNPSQKLYFPAHSTSDLQGIYALITNSITSYNLGQGSWNEQ